VPAQADTLEPFHAVPTEAIIGEGYVEACVEDMARIRTRPICNGMTKNERNKLHTDIAKTIRPASHRGPPINLGKESHRKLKADKL